MKRLFTIGYEGASLDGFLQALRDADIDVLLDIRETAYSRRAEFGKKSLAGALAGAGMGYRHERKLGTPRLIRDKLRRDGDREAFKRAFMRHLEKQNALLLELAESLSGNIALLCYEKDPRLCHRSLVAAALTEMTGLTPKHLTAKTVDPQRELF